MRTAIGIAAIGLLAALVLWGGRSAGATLRALTLDDLVAESDLIVRGVALGERTLRDARRGIVRIVELRVDERYRGEAGARVNVELLGGVLAGQATHVPGEAEIDPGDEVLLFLERIDSARRFRVVGMAQGMFRVVRDPLSKAAFAARALGEVRLVGSPAGDRLGLARACTSSFLALELLEQAIRDALRDQPAVSPAGI